MRKAEDLTDAILDGQEVPLTVGVDDPQRIAQVIDDVGADVEIESSTP